MKILTDTQGKVLMGDGNAYNAKIFEPSKIEWHQCPTSPKEFIADVQDNDAYNSSNRSTVTYIDRYILADPTAAEAAANTKPLPKVIDDVLYTDNEPFVATPFATQNTAGTLEFLDKLRWYNTTTASGTHYTLGTNCRDLGGWGLLRRNS